MCPQRSTDNACNYQFFYKNSFNKCCPKDDQVCSNNFEGFFCNADGTFKKDAFTATGCDVPKLGKICGDYLITAGTTCCPIPGFEMDPVYLGKYATSTGTITKPPNCDVLRLFPKNAWSVMGTYKDADYTAAKTIDGLIPVGSLWGQQFYLNLKTRAEVFATTGLKFDATLTQFGTASFDTKVNWTTKGRVFNAT